MLSALPTQLRRWLAGRRSRRGPTVAPAHIRIEAADALQLLQQRSDLCRRLGENGLAKVRRSFTVDKVAAELRTLLGV